MAKHRFTLKVPWTMKIPVALEYSKIRLIAENSPGCFLFKFVIFPFNGKSAFSFFPSFFPMVSPFYLLVNILKTKSQ